MEQVGRYRVTGELGRGSMGVVLAAEDPQLQRAVAIKLLNLEGGAREEGVQRFLREARAAAKLNHPNVVMIHEINEQGGQPYLVTELLTGGSLQQWVEGESEVSWREATRAIADACRGLAAAHAAGLVHRDIKPANLLLSGTNTVKVADFGLAKGPSESTLTAAGTVFGTPHYMSPEQWGSEPLTALTDVWSLGGTYYTLLTGEPPFGNKEPLQIMYACCSGKAPDPRNVRNDLPEGCTKIVQRAMAKELQDRYPSAAAMLEDLEELLHDPTLAGAGPLTARISNAPTLPNELAKVNRPAGELIGRRGLMIGAGIAAAAILGGGILAGVTWFATNDGWEDLIWSGKSFWRDFPGGNGETKWVLEDGILVGRGSTCMLRSAREDYGDFELQLTAMSEGGWGGIWLRSRERNGKREGVWVNISAGDLGGVHREYPVEPSGLFSDGVDIGRGTWETIRIEVKRKRILVKGADRLIAEITEDDASTEDQVPRKGEIVLVTEGPESTIRIREFKLREQK